MKLGRTLRELAMELERQNAVKKDYIADTRMMRMDGNGEQILSLGDSAQHRINQFGINEVAHRQIANALGIPKPYYDRMMRDDPELLNTNVNNWFLKEPKSRMIRTLDGTARAMLSERYRRIDNMEIAEAVLPILMERDDTQVESCEVTDTKMYIKVVSPRITEEVSVGDVVQGGIVVSNSEVGLGSVRVEPLIYRLVCKNGMIVNDAAQNKRHLGRINAQDDDFGIFRDETVEADDKAYLMKAQDTVRAALDPAKFSGFVQLMRDSKDAKIVTTEIPQMVELVARDFGLSKKEGGGVLDHLIRGGEFSLYGLANAITRHSQDIPDYDRATVLESTGFDVMTMSRGAWRKYNNVAA